MARQRDGRGRVKLLGSHARRNPSPLATRLPYARSTNALTGTLDPGLGRGWPLMEVLELSDNQLRGPLPPSFAAMNRLQMLDLK